MNYNSWFDKNPFGAITIDDNAKIKLKSYEDFEKIDLVFYKGFDEILRVELEKNIYDYKITLPKFSEGIYNYHFEAYINGNVRFFGKNEFDGNIKEFSKDFINKYQLTVYKKVEVPNWYKKGVMYNIFVDRFNNGNKSGKINSPKKNSFIYANWSDEPMYIKDNDGNIIRWDFFGGNLKGVIEKLNYLSKLGVSIIYLNPIFEARSNHKYDTGNYKKIDPMFGDEETLKELIEKADKKGIKIILDGVFSHTGVDSIYFNKFNNYDEIGAYNSEESKYFNWYKFKNYPNEYECWWGIDDLPNVDEMNESYRNYIIHNKDSVLNKWISMGIKGFRLDVADELPTQFIREFRKRLKEVDSDSVLVGEVWEDASNKVSYGETRTYLLGEELDSVMGYPFRNNMVYFLKGHISSSDLVNRFMTIKENYPKEAFKSNLNILSSHDTTRILTELDNDKELVKLAVLTQMTFEGVPYIYYGDEAGLFGGNDPENRKTYPWKNEDTETLNFYKNAVNFRNKNETLKIGDTEFLYTDDDIFSFIRKDEKEILVLINRSNEDKNIEITDKVLEEIFIDNKNKIKIENNNILLNKKSYRIFNVLKSFD